MEVYRTLRSAIENNESIAVITITRINRIKQTGDLLKFVGDKLLIWPDGRIYEGSTGLPQQMKNQLLINATKALNSRSSKTYVANFEECEMEYYVEVFPSPLHLIVAGAGHVAKPVVQIGKMIGFYITVICDRPEFANSDQFPWANEVICKPYLEYFSNLPTLDDTYVLLITRGHKYDVMILREIFNKPAAYIGMIGSRRRVSGVFSQLHKEFPLETFENIYAPIGLDIGAQTPEEIAISILAEILAVKYRKSGKSLREEVGHFIVREKERDGNDRS